MIELFFCQRFSFLICTLPAGNSVFASVITVFTSENSIAASYPSSAALHSLSFFEARERGLFTTNKSENGVTVNMVAIAAEIAQ